MNRVLFLFYLAIILSSCSLHTSTGIMSPLLGRFSSITKGRSKPLSAIITNTQLEGTYHTKHIAFSAGAGPTTVQPLDGRSPMHGGEVGTRITWKATDAVQPYLHASSGFFYHTSKWEGSDVSYEISARLGAGLAFNVAEGCVLTMDYSWVHFSNGATVLDDKTRQLFGLEKASINNEFESGALFIGLNYSF